MSAAAVPSGLRALDFAVERWNLMPDGPPFATASSLLAPVRRADGTPAILKHPLVLEEQLGNRVMVWWGNAGSAAGSAAVLEHDASTILLERATGPRSLVALAEGAEGFEGDAAGDDAATRILCQTVARLHSVSPWTSQPGSRPAPPTLVNELPTLTEWFTDLFARDVAHDVAPGEQRGGFFARAAADARVLLAEQRGSVVLHGDIHHGNVLDFGDAGWLAIDPKGIDGDPIFDYLNLFCNPTPAVAMRRGRLARQLAVVADATAYEPEVLLRWLRAWCALSATWFELDGLPADHVLAVGTEAERLLGVGTGRADL